jgi:uncharacterized delta-60 repeat protein
MGPFSRKSVLGSLLGLLSVLATQGSALAIPGDPDSSFGSGGAVTTNFTSGNDEAITIARQLDGRIVVGGFSRPGGFNTIRFALARYESDGDPDHTFGGDGKRTTDFGKGASWINELATDGEGRIVAAGCFLPAGTTNTKIALARYKAGGGLDTKFGGDGKVTTNFTPGWECAEDVVVRADGRILLGGGIGGSGGQFGLVRYKTNGALDSTFSGDGRVATNFDTGFDHATALAIQGDGGIVLAGSAGPTTGNDNRFALARYNPGGSLDSSFGDDGKVTTDLTDGNDQAWDLAIQPTSEIVAVGVAAGSGERFALVRYDSSGDLDGSFGTGGIQILNLDTGSDVLASVVLQEDGNILAAGWTGPLNANDYSFVLARFEADGTPDQAFGGDGIVTTNFTGGDDHAWDLMLQPNGRAVATGRAASLGGEFALVRYLTT